MSTPTSRLCNVGPDALSLSELLSVLIDPRDTDGSAAAAARRILSTFAREDGGGPLRGFARASPGEVARRAALRVPTAARIVAAIEIGRRAMEERTPRRALLRSGAEIHEFMHWRLRDLVQEEYHAILLGSRSEVRRRVQITVGTADASLVSPREVYRLAILEGASAVVLVHNHPSGDPTPSDDDRRITRELAQAGETVHIRLADHVIIGDDRWFSFRDAGEMRP